MIALVAPAGKWNIRGGASDPFLIDACQEMSRGHMTIDETKVDAATLALLMLGLHSGNRAWKGFDWATLDRLHEAGFIHSPAGKAKSIVFTEDGLARARAECEKLFAADC